MTSNILLFSKYIQWAREMKQFISYQKFHFQNDAFNTIRPETFNIGKLILIYSQILNCDENEEKKLDEQMNKTELET